MEAKKVFTDMMNRQVEITFPPQRIISVVPSQTELLYDLGLDKEVVGITKFCVHPNQWFRDKERIGGTKKLNLNKIMVLQPDLIIANKEENTKEDIDFLAERFPVWISDIMTIEDSMEMIKVVGSMINKTNLSRNLATQIFNNFLKLDKTAKAKRVAYFIWKNPWMTAGKDTFINNIIEKIGWQNVYAHKSRYPETSIEELRNLNPELVLLSSEPYPFNKKHIAAIMKLLPDVQIILVDGEMFSWYGSRLKLAPAYLRELI